MKVKKRKVFTILLILSCIVLITIETHAELKLDSVYPTNGVMGEDLEVTLTGTGFDEETRVSMYLDVGNKRLIVGSEDTPGLAYGVTIESGYAYMADGDSGFLVINISNPSLPKIVGSVDTPGDANGLTVAGNYAYVADGNSGLQIIDINTLQIIGSKDTPGDAHGLTVAGGYAYVADGNSGLQVIDISTPSSPQIIGSVDTVNAYGVAVADDHAYVADDGNGLNKIDVSNPSQPQIIGSIDTPGDAYGVAVEGGYAYVADGFSGLQVIDINTWQIITVDTPHNAYNVSVFGGYAYVADWDSGLQVIDISSPTNPKIIGSVNTPGRVYDVTVVGDYAYVADHVSGLQVIDISNPSQLESISSVDTPYYAFGVDVEGDYAYVADGGSGLQVIDISDIGSPKVIGAVDTPDIALGVDVFGNYAYVADKYSLQIIDISNPSHPEIIGSTVIMVGIGEGVAFSNGYVYVTDWSNRLHVIDVSSPSNPQIISLVNIPDESDDIAVVGSYAYVAAWSSGLQVIDISNPSQPQIIGSVYTPNFAIGVTVWDNYAYVADGYSGLQNVDISNPSQPQIIGSIDTPGPALNVAVSDGYAYVADYQSVQVINISNPLQPQIIGSIETQGDAYDVIVDGDYVFIADGFSGLTIAPLIVEIEPVTANSETSISLTLPSPPMAGHYTLRVFNETESDELHGAVTFADEIVSKAIIVAGFGPPDLDNGIHNNIWEETQMLATWAYKALIYQGYTHENIYYLSPVDFVPYYHGDQVINIRDGDATAADLSYAINTWVGDPGNPSYNLLLYMVDHGGPEYYRIRFNEILYAQDLDTWLDNVQAAMSGKMMFIYEACQSGSFIPSVIPPAGNELDRIVMTSSAYDEPSVIDQNGKLTFSFQFWASVLNGDYVVNAFNFGRTMMKSFQDAKLDADGDGVANTKGDNIAGLVIGRGYRPASDVPYISTASASQTLYGKSTAVISASGIIDANGIQEVWAVIIGPDYNSGAPDVPITDLPKVELLDPDEDGAYEGTYPDFSMLGTYRVSIYAVDQEGTTSLPRNTTVTQMNGPDIYEEDDTNSQANVFVLHNAVQQHNFHDTADEDWVKFYGLFEENYTIKASNLGSSADVVIELYDIDGTTLLETQDTIGDPQADEILEWPCPQEGIYYVKVRHHDPNVSGENTEYDLEVYRPIAPTLTCLVRGTVSDESSGEKIGDARVSTNSGVSAMSLAEPEDIRGSYIFFHSPVPPGTIEITALADRYEPGVVIIDDCPSGGTVIKDIMMTKSCTDIDGDGYAVEGGECGPVDNCSETSNAGQCDTDDDGYGNACDADVDNDGFVGPIDYDTCGMAWWTNPTSPNWNPDCDCDCDGFIGPIDYDCFGQRWWTTEPWR